MEVEVDVNSLRPGMRYTFTKVDMYVFRATLKSYTPENGKAHMALCLICVTGLQGSLNIPKIFIHTVTISCLPYSSFFNLFLPEANMKINNYI
jgi:hypothetical protein